MVFLVVLLAALILVRVVALGEFFLEEFSPSLDYGIAQTTGNRQIQADRAELYKSSAGILAVLADGIGKENTGQVCGQIGMDTVLDAFESYRELHNPEYFFRTAFGEAHLRIQRTIGERYGGACLAAVFVSGRVLHYALAGDIRIALWRNQELIPLSKGHTLDVLAMHAYEEGRLSKREAVWSMEEKRCWNYLGMDGFHEIELPERPVRLRAKDRIVMVSKGIWQELSWAELEDILAAGESCFKQAAQAVREAEKKPGEDKENGSIVLFSVLTSGGGER
ncbi:protein serine/threonine phosphatase 2C family protein [bacterium D16-54]|nr:protein serine/threonine phosphatase 2C family protein [bacterium D16-54]RKJ15263.1 protein serine/threonine phosphatase 2C family protein [bacterium D16-56]